MSGLALVAVACHLAAVCAVPAYAEQAVGLEAQGVDPWAALRNRRGLDVRDELGRPVSAHVIRKQLAAASGQAVERKASLSRLPKARVIFRLQELLSSLTEFWGLPFPLNPARGVWALTPSPRSGEKPAAVSEAAGAVSLALVLGVVLRPALSRRLAAATVSLRC